MYIHSHYTAPYKFNQFAVCIHTKGLLFQMLNDKPINKED